MTDNNRDDIIFDAMCKAAFEQYIMDEAQTLPSKEGTDALYPVPQKGLNRLKRVLKGKKHNSPLYMVYLRRVAVIILATVSFAFGILLSNNEIRASIKDTIVEWYNEYIDFNFSGEKAPIIEIEEEEKLLYDYKIGYIPNGFELVDINEIDYDRSYIYHNSFNEYIYISISESNNLTISADNENYEYIEIVINGNDAYLLYDESLNDGSVTWCESNYTIFVSGCIEKQELLKIAESIK